MFSIWSKHFAFACVLALLSVQAEDNMSTEAYKFRDGEFVAGHVIFRHGDRNVARTCPNDPYKDVEHWPGGFGQLTEIGKDRLYRLGEYLRRRYDQYLGTSYSSDRIHILSTDTDRTLMSAQLMLAGLFKPTPDQKWNNIIPIYTTPREFDYKLGGNACMRLQHNYDYYLKESPIVQQIYKEYDHEFKIWSEKSGCNVTTINHVFNLFDTLIIENSLNKTLESWAQEAIQLNGPMRHIVKVAIQAYTGTKEIAKLQTGFLIKDFIQHFDHKIYGQSSLDRSLLFYSAHDFTIANVLNSIGMHVESSPPYASSLHFELIKLNGQHYIQIFYRKTEEEYPEALNIPGCGQSCTLPQFYEIYKDIIPNDFHSECIDSCPLVWPYRNVTVKENRFFFLKNKIIEMYNILDDLDD